MMKNPQLVQIGAYLCRGPLADSCASNSRERKLNVLGNQRSMCGDLLRLLTQTPIQLTSRAQQLFLEVSRTKQKSREKVRGYLILKAPGGRAIHWQRCLCVKLTLALKTISTGSGDKVTATLQRGHIFLKVSP